MTEPTETLSAAGARDRVARLLEECELLRERCFRAVARFEAVAQRAEASDAAAAAAREAFGPALGEMGRLFNAKVALRDACVSLDAGDEPSRQLRFRAAGLRAEWDVLDSTFARAAAAVPGVRYEPPIEPPPPAPEAAAPEPLEPDPDQIARAQVWVIERLAEIEAELDAQRPKPTTLARRAERPPLLTALRRVTVVSAVLGFLALYFVFYELVGTSWATSRSQASLRAEFARASAGGPGGEAVRLGNPRPSGAPLGTGIAHIRIPRLDLDAIVVEGAGLEQLAKGPGRYPLSAPFGAPGASAIAGHRTGWGSPFGELDRLRPGDLVRVTTRLGTLTYRVSGSDVVRPRDVWVLQGDPGSRASHRLALTTCTPRFSARKRLVVWADLVEAGPGAVAGWAAPPG